MRNNEKLGGATPPKLSHDAAKVIYNEMSVLDGAIVKARARIDNAILEIADNMQKLAVMEEKRLLLSGQLDMFAPDDFMSPVEQAADQAAKPMAPAMPVSPFPPAPKTFVAGEFVNPYGEKFARPYGCKPWHRDSVMPKRTTFPSYPSPATTHPEYGDL